MPPRLLLRETVTKRGQGAVKADRWQHRQVQRADDPLPIDSFQGGQELQVLKSANPDRTETRGLISQALLAEQGEQVAVDDQAGAHEIGPDRQRN